MVSSNILLHEIKSESELIAELVYHKDSWINLPIASKIGDAIRKVLTVVSQILDYYLVDCSSVSPVDLLESYPDVKHTSRIDFLHEKRVLYHLPFFVNYYEDLIEYKEEPDHAIRDAFTDLYSVINMIATDSPIVLGAVKQAVDYNEMEEKIKDLLTFADKDISNMSYTQIKDLMGIWMEIVKQKRKKSKESNEATSEKENSEKAKRKDKSKKSNEAKNETPEPYSVFKDLFSKLGSDLMKLSGLTIKICSSEHPIADRMVWQLYITFRKITKTHLSRLRGSMALTQELEELTRKMLGRIIPKNGFRAFILALAEYEFDVSQNIDPIIANKLQPISVITSQDLSLICSHASQILLMKEMQNDSMVKTNIGKLFGAIIQKSSMYSCEKEAYERYLKFIKNATEHNTMALLIPDVMVQNKGDHPDDGSITSNLYSVLTSVSLNPQNLELLQTITRQFSDNIGKVLKSIRDKNLNADPSVFSQYTLAEVSDAVDKLREINHLYHVTWSYLGLLNNPDIEKNLIWIREQLTSGRLSGLNNYFLGYPPYRTEYFTSKEIIFTQTIRLFGEHGSSSDMKKTSPVDQTIRPIIAIFQSLSNTLRKIAIQRSAERNADQKIKKYQNFTDLEEDSDDNGGDFGASENDNYSAYMRDKFTGYKAKAVRKYSQLTVKWTNDLNALKQSLLKYYADYQRDHQNERLYMADDDLKRRCNSLLNDSQTVKKQSRVAVKIICLAFNFPIPAIHPRKQIKINHHQFESAVRYYKSHPDFLKKLLFSLVNPAEPMPLLIQSGSKDKNGIPFEIMSLKTDHAQLVNWIFGYNYARLQNDLHSPLNPYYQYNNAANQDLFSIIAKGGSKVPDSDIYTPISDIYPKSVNRRFFRMAAGKSMQILNSNLPRQIMLDFLFSLIKVLHKSSPTDAAKFMFNITLSKKIIEGIQTEILKHPEINKLELTYFDLFNMISQARNLCFKMMTVGCLRMVYEEQIGVKKVQMAYSRANQFRTIHQPMNERFVFRGLDADDFKIIAKLGDTPARQRARLLRDYKKISKAQNQLSENERKIMEVYEKLKKKWKELMESNEVTLYMLNETAPMFKGSGISFALDDNNAFRLDGGLHLSKITPAAGMSQFSHQNVISVPNPANIRSNRIDTGLLLSNTPKSISNSVVKEFEWMSPELVAKTPGKITVNVPYKGSVLAPKSGGDSSIREGVDVGKHHKAVCAVIRAGKSERDPRTIMATKFIDRFPLAYRSPRFGDLDSFIKHFSAHPSLKILFDGLTRNDASEIYQLVHNGIIPQSSNLPFGNGLLDLIKQVAQTVHSNTPKLPELEHLIVSNAGRLGFMGNLFLHRNSSDPGSETKARMLGYAIIYGYTVQYLRSFPRSEKNAIKKRGRSLLRSLANKLSVPFSHLDAKNRRGTAAISEFQKSQTPQARINSRTSGQKPVNRLIKGNLVKKNIINASNRKISQRSKAIALATAAQIHGLAGLLNVSETAVENLKFTGTFSAGTGHSNKGFLFSMIQDRLRELNDLKGIKTTYMRAEKTSREWYVDYLSGNQTGTVRPASTGVYIPEKNASNQTMVLKYAEQKMGSISKLAGSQDKKEINRDLGAAIAIAGRSFNSKKSS